MAKVPINNPKFWRERAEEARTKAEEITNPDSKRRMLRFARDWGPLQAVPVMARAMAERLA